jgi:predicted Zn-dependent protease with MMP-like domain
MDEDEDLLGLYQGLSIDHESFFQTGGQLPAKISIYRGPILRICRTKTEVVQEVRDTVVHEIGHHFGLDDDEMPY